MIYDVTRLTPEYAASMTSMLLADALGNDFSVEVIVGGSTMAISIHDVIPYYNFVRAEIPMSSRSLEALVGALYRRTKDMRGEVISKLPILSKPFSRRRLNVQRSNAQLAAVINSLKAIHGQTLASIVVEANRREPGIKRFLRSVLGDETDGSRVRVFWDAVDRVLAPPGKCKSFRECWILAGACELELLRRTGLVSWNRNGPN